MGEIQELPDLMQIPATKDLHERSDFLAKHNHIK